MHVTGFDPWLVFRLARRPVWLLGFTSMLAGFALQVTALRYGPLALVQPILAAELLFVFAYLAVLTGRRRARQVRLREWLAAVGMSAGISVFLFAAAPSGGRPHAPASLWWLAGLIIGGCVLLLLALATRLSRVRADSEPDAGWKARQAVRRAAILGVATGISWGFVAAVIKENQFSRWPGPGRGVRQLGSVCSRDHRCGGVPAGLPRVGRRATRSLPARVHDRRPDYRRRARRVPVQRVDADQRRSLWPGRWPG